MNETRQSLLLRAQTGETAAWKDLTDLYRPLILGWLNRQGVPAGDLEDLGQEVFLQLYQNLAAIQSASHLGHWLRRVAVHRCIDHTRRKRFRYESLVDENHEVAAISKPGDSFLSARLRQTVTQLREKERMVILLRYQEEMELAEIAEVLSMPLNTVKSTLFRALQNLRGKLIHQVKEARYAFF